MNRPNGNKSEKPQSAIELEGVNLQFTCVRINTVPTPTLNLSIAIYHRDK